MVRVMSRIRAARCGGAGLSPVARADWLRAPEGLEPVPGGSVTTPAGFRAAGVACGLKPSGLRDVGVLVADRPTVSAMVDTTSALPSAPVVRNSSTDAPAASTDSLNPARNSTE